MIEDVELLRRFAEEDAQDAFSELVRRHIDFVYATALRQVRGNVPLARDVTQLVFIDLARKAARLTRHSALIGWLHTATRFAVNRSLRSEVRRIARERDDRAADALIPADSPAADWSNLQPLLDDVLGMLRERERTAILLRFFEGKPLAEVGAQLALSETAARSCVDRALERMRILLARRGVTSTSAGLAMALTGHVSVAAPSGLAASVTTAGLASAAASTAGVWASLLVMSKIKTGVVTVIILTGLATVAVDVRANRALRTQLAGTRTDTSEAAALQQQSTKLRTALAKLSDKNPEFAELSRLRARVAALQARPPGVLDSEMKPVMNQGRATPEATFVTFTANLNAGDLDGVASLIAFDRDTQQARDAFMASLSEAVRLRYRTPERVFAAGLFNRMREGVPDPNPAVAAQIVGMQEREPGTIRVQLWIRRASGEESEIQEKFRRTPQGWAIMFRPLSYERVAAEVRARFDPVTGEPHRPATR